ncbi:MAG: hypothetical protein ACRD2X_16745 [Vicinamibacteraceae bacterium]
MTHSTSYKVNPKLDLVLERVVDIPRELTTLAPHGNGGTKYTTLAMHKNENDCKRHDEMGFQDSWGKVLEQRVMVAKSM